MSWLTPMETQVGGASSPTPNRYTGRWSIITNPHGDKGIWSITNNPHKDTERWGVVFRELESDEIQKVIKDLELKRDMEQTFWRLEFLCSPKFPRKTISSPPCPPIVEDLGIQA